MFSRREGTIVSLPMRLLALPAILGGAWMTMGTQVRTTDVGDWQTRVTLGVATPDLWFATPGGFIGAGLLLIGVALAVAGQVTVVRKRALGSMRYPAFAYAGHILLVGLAASLWGLSGNSFDATSQGASATFIATLRVEPVNLASSIGVALGCLACYALSFGRLPRPQPVQGVSYRQPPARPAEPPRRDDTRVPAATHSRPAPRMTSAAGVVTHTPSPGAAKPPARPAKALS
jgi:hypothetical protein